MYMYMYKIYEHTRTRAVAERKDSPALVASRLRHCTRVYIHTRKIANIFMIVMTYKYIRQGETPESNRIRKTPLKNPIILLISFCYNSEHSKRHN